MDKELELLKIKLSELNAMAQEESGIKGKVLEMATVIRRMETKSPKKNLNV